ncbi:embryonic skeletal system development [Rhizoctonia solani]|uniref:Embryonic skeletal system development n=1 Tax=Rhizoctonia solani TaxID=456999 RepID=A0A8H7H118_9AGAM|nr:embryonic skeletal system development [Rhizoctonia solani]
MLDQHSKVRTKLPKSAPDSTRTDPIQSKDAFTQPSSCDRLATDRIGEELNPDACIWRLYAEEAKEYDGEMAYERNKNLDTMLLFATLFSAIVTAFLMESTDLLEQDSSEVSTQLLLKLLHSQQRIEMGVSDSTAPIFELPNFVPSATARLINILWFTALMISLGAAVVAILAKEWLSAFMSYRTRQAHEYALQRQARLISLDTWNLLPIIDLLPTLLNFALFVFSVGLIVRLWILDFVVAAVITTVSTIVGGIYLFVVISGAVNPPEICPYQARLSFYIRRMLSQSLFRFLGTNRCASPGSPKFVKSTDLSLLTWLHNHSSDPTLKSYVTQALAGLRSLNLGLPKFWSTRKKPEELRIIYQRNSQIIGPLFDLGAQAIDQLQMMPVKALGEPLCCGGLGAARLAIGISEIYPHALTWQLCLPEEAYQIQRTPLMTSLHTRELILPGVWTNSPTIASQHSTLKQNTHGEIHAISIANARKITESIFNALDLVWAAEWPALTPSAYAYLVAAELKIVRHALASLNSYENEKTRASQHHKTIEMVPTCVQAGLQNLDENSLQLRCSSVLTRTALVLKSSVSHLKSKGSQEVQSAMITLILEATKLIAQEKPRSSNNTRRFGTPGYSDTLNKEISITIISESNTMHRIGCKRRIRNFELMEVLLELCGDGNTMGELPLETFRVAAFNLLLNYWPAYLRQWRVDDIEHFTQFPWKIQDWEEIPFQTAPYSPQKLSEITIYRSIVLASIATSLHWMLGRCDLLQLVLEPLVSGSSILSKSIRKFKRNATPRALINFYRWLPTNEALEQCCMAIDPTPADSILPADEEIRYKISWCIARLIATTRAFVDGTRTVDIFSLARLKHSHSTEHKGARVDWVMEIIYAASQAAEQDITAPVIGILLDQVTSYIPEVSSDCNFCLSSFTRGRGFYIISKVGLAEPGRATAIATVRVIMSQLRATGFHVDKKAIPPLFDALCLVCDSLKTWVPESFIQDVIFQLQQFPDGISQFVTPNTIIPIQKVLCKLKDSAEHWNSWGKGGIRSINEITSLQAQVWQREDKIFQGSSHSVEELPQKTTLSIPLLVEPLSNTVGSKPGDEALKLALIPRDPVASNPSNPAPSFINTSDTTLVPDESSKDNELQGIPNSAGGSGLTRPLPAELLALLKPGDESSDEEHEQWGMSFDRESCTRLYTKYTIW